MSEARSAGAALVGAYGWRGRIGYIAPAVVYDVQGIEFYQLLPDGVMVTVTTLGIDGLETNDSTEAALQNLESTTSILDRFNADVVCLGGNPPGAFRGLAGERDILDRMARCTTKPVTTSPRSALDALAFLGAAKIAIASPMPPLQNDQLAAYFEEAGVKVTNVAGPHMRHNEVRLLGRDASYRASKEAFFGGARPDAVYLPCMAWPTVVNVPLLEAELGVPVFSSVMSMAWNALRMLKIVHIAPELGMLFGRSTSNE